MKHIETRDYQRRAIDDVAGAMLRGCRAILVVAPCGAGKTVMASDMMKRTAAKGKRCVFFADAIELVEQTSETLDALGIPFGRSGGHGVIMDGWEYMPELPIQVASVQSWWSWIETRKKHGRPNFDLAIFDEAQSSTADTRASILRQFAYRIGLSATPATGKGKGLGVRLDDGTYLWDAMVNVVTYERLLSQGHLVPITAFAPTMPDLSGVDRNYDNGDYVLNAKLVSVMSTREIYGDVWENWDRLASDRTTIVFGIDIDHCLALRNLFRRNGVTAEHIDGNTPRADRKRILAAVRSGDVQVLTNFKVFGRGVDIPLASAVVNCRPFGNVVGWRQAMSRIQRPCEGKTDALLIDHTGSLLRFGFPDTDIEWPLHDDQTPVMEAVVGEWERRPKAERQQTICPKCKAYREGGHACPKCGFKPERQGGKVEVHPGSLEEVCRDKARKSSKAVQNEKVWMQCLAVASYRNQTVRAAMAMYRAKTGGWPDGLKPMPDPDKRDVKVSVLYPGFVRKRKGTPDDDQRPGSSPPHAGV